MAELNLALLSGPRLSRCDFSIKKSNKQSKKEYPIKCEFTISIELEKKSKKSHVLLAAKSDSEALPFYFDIEAEARFTCETDCASEPEVIEEAIPYIFPFLKELVADLTRKANFTPFYLPAIAFKAEALQNVELTEATVPKTRRRTKKEA